MTGHKRSLTPGCCRLPSPKRFACCSALPAGTLGPSERRSRKHAGTSELPWEAGEPSNCPSSCARMMSRNGSRPDGLAHDWAAGGTAGIPVLPPVNADGNLGQKCQDLVFDMVNRKCRTVAPATEADATRILGYHARKEVSWTEWFDRPGLTVSQPPQERRQAAAYRAKRAPRPFAIRSGMGHRLRDDVQGIFHMALGLSDALRSLERLPRNAKPAYRRSGVATPGPGYRPEKS